MTIEKSVEIEKEVTPVKKTTRRRKTSTKTESREVAKEKAKQVAEAVTEVLDEVEKIADEFEPESEPAKFVPPYVCLLYFPERDTDPASWAKADPGLVALRQLEIALHTDYVEDGKSKTRFECIYLSPGTNIDVPYALWEKANKLDSVKLKIKRRAIVELETNKKINFNKLDSSLFDDLELEELIQNCYDSNLLLSWQNTDSREEVFRMIERRIQDINALGFVN